MYRFVIYIYTDRYTHRDMCTTYLHTLLYYVSVFVFVGSDNAAAVNQQSRGTGLHPGKLGINATRAAAHWPQSRAQAALRNCLLQGGHFGRGHKPDVLQQLFDMLPAALRLATGRHFQQLFQVVAVARKVAIGVGVRCLPAPASCAFSACFDEDDSQA